MIVTQLSGGLGNQLFQYAFGRANAEKNNTELLLDITLLKYPKILKNYVTKRRYELGAFEKIKPNFFLKDPFPGFISQNANSLRFFYKIRRKFKQRSLGLSVVQEDKTGVEALLNVPDNSYLVGHFQSEIFFDQIGPTLREEFSFPTEVNEQNKYWIRKIATSNSFSMHIRRGDYLLPHNRPFHQVLNPDYYKSAVDLIRNLFPGENPALFIFSDDMEWCRKSLNFLDLECHFLDHNNPDNAFEDLRLMSRCKHNVLSCSSFSYWGAWLNDHQDQIIIAPKRWVSTFQSYNKLRNLIHLDF